MNVCVGASCGGLYIHRVIAGSALLEMQPTAPIIPVKTYQPSTWGHSELTLKTRRWDFPHHKPHISLQLSTIGNDSISQDRDSTLSFAIHCGDFAYLSCANEREISLIYMLIRRAMLMLALRLITELIFHIC